MNGKQDDGAGHATSSVANPTLAVDSAPRSAPTAVSLTQVGGTVVANTVNTTNTNLNMSATITAGQATGGKAEFYVNGVLKGTDSSIGAADTSRSEESRVGKECRSRLSPYH